jgi:hypothetical protein
VSLDAIACFAVICSSAVCVCPGCRIQDIRTQNRHCRRQKPLASGVEDALNVNTHALPAPQMFLERRVKGPCVAAHAVYHDEQYFKAVTGLTDTKWIACKRTETTVSFSPWQQA